MRKLHSMIGNNNISKFHVSQMIRGSIAPVPGDNDALCAGTLLNVCYDIGPTGGTTIQWKVFNQLKTMMKVRIKTNAQKVFSPIISNLFETEPSAYWTTDQDTSTSLKVTSALLSSDICNTLCDESFKLQDIMRQLVCLEMYYFMRNKFRSTPEAREQTIINILGIDIEKDKINLTDIGEPDIFSKEDVPKFQSEEFNSNVDKIGLNISTRFHKIISNITSIHRCMFGTDNAMSFGCIFGVDEDHLKLMSITFSIVFDSESARIDKETRTMKTPDITNNNKCMEFIQSIIESRFKKDWNYRVVEKKIKEEKLLATQICNEMIEADIPRFKEILKTISTRQEKCHQNFVNCMCDPKYKSYKNWYQKMWLIILARNNNGDVIYVNGNVISATSSQWKKYQNAYIECGGRWDELLLMKKSYGHHEYRESGVSNRHGHSTEFPSYFAMGYSSMEEMRLTETPETYWQYCKEHRNCCGRRDKAELPTLEEYLKICV